MPYNKENPWPLKRMQVLNADVQATDLTSIEILLEHAGKKNGHHRKVGVRVMLVRFYARYNLPRHLYRAGNGRFYIKMDGAAMFLSKAAQARVQAAMDEHFRKTTAPRPVARNVLSFGDEEVTL